MAKQKKETTRSATFAQGGKTHMFGAQAAGAEKAGTTATDAAGGAPGAKFASGGSTKMHGYSPAVPAQAGITSAR